MTVAQTNELSIENVKSQLRQFILKELLMGRVASLADDDELLLSGLVDSLGAVRLITFIETELNAKIPPEDVIIENFQSVDAMAAYLAGRAHS
jgi:acyl carrier protein